TKMHAYATFCRYLFNSLRTLRVGRKERSDGIASKQVRLVRASVTIIPQTRNYIVISTNVEKSHPYEYKI
ncbi:MAG: hypothetical protein OSJ74_09320, partial [Clostridia bacterium]|nr:hypothetical protein [Clostridia bacterium]